MSVSDSGSAGPGAFVSRLERFDVVDSTQAVVRGWLADGVPEVCVAVADTQSEGRGRLGRTWQAQPGRSLLASAGFRPHSLAIAHGWRLPAIVSMAMLEASTALLGPTADRLALKWPNDIVAVHHGRLLKVAGVLAEGSSRDLRFVSNVVGIGINVDWAKEAYPEELTTSMWSLSEASGGRRVDREALLSSWLARLESMYADLAEGIFDVERWMAQQVTTGGQVEVDRGESVVRGIAVGFDGDSGALLVQSESAGAVERIEHGDVVRCVFTEVPSGL